MKTTSKYLGLAMFLSVLLIGISTAEAEEAGTIPVTTPSQAAPSEASLSDEDLWYEMAEDFHRMRGHLFRIFNDFQASPWNGVFENTGGMDVIQRGNQYIIRMDLPGVAKEDLDVTIQDDFLTVQGRRNDQWVSEKDEAGQYIYRSSQRFGEFSKTVRLPETVKSEGVKARYENGVLELVFEYREKTQPKSIKVDVK